MLYLIDIFYSVQTFFNHMNKKPILEWRFQIKIMSCTYKKLRKLAFVLPWQQLTRGEQCLSTFCGIYVQVHCSSMRSGCSLPVA